MKLTDIISKIFPASPKKQRIWELDALRGICILGIAPAGFASADYFPLLPYLGYFLLGAAAGRRLYPTRTSLFPQFHSDGAFLRFLQSCGTHSLLIYLLHQPILIGLCTVLSALL